LLPPTVTESHNTKATAQAFIKPRKPSDPTSYAKTFIELEDGGDRNPCLGRAVYLRIPEDAYLVHLG
jgi:hypothetical protein